MLYVFLFSLSPNTSTYLVTTVVNVMKISSFFRLEPHGKVVGFYETRDESKPEEVGYFQEYSVASIKTLTYITFKHIF